MYDHKPGAQKDGISFPVRYKKDEYTQELASQVANELYRLTEKWPHVVMCNLYRGKMDANAEINEACFGVRDSIDAWKAYHKFIQGAKDSFKGPGLFLDLHGQVHCEEWVELGYLITGEQLNNQNFTSAESSIRALAKRMCRDETEFVDILYGHKSFGALLEQNNYKTIPSPTITCPNEGNYFSGRYNITRHGSRSGGVMDAIQIETPRYLRNKEHCPQYAQALAKCIYSFLQTNYKA